MPDDLTVPGSLRQDDLPPIAIDFETYWDNSYSLKKLDTILYVRDPRFEVIGFSFAESGRAAEWVTGPADYIALRLAELQLPRRTVIAHNAMFEGAILEWIFRITPKRYLCSMMLARPFVVPFTGTANLRAVASFLGLGDKGDFAEKEAAGKHRGDFMPTELARYGMYCCNDTELSSQIVDKLAVNVVQDELDLIDLTVKKFTRPRLVLDDAGLAEAQEENEQKEAIALLRLAGYKLNRQAVTSNPQLAEQLKKRGVVPPMKISPTTGRPTLAASKKDPEFMALLTHPDPEVRLLVETRLILKSSIERTRLAKFLDLSRVSQTLPVPLLYYGAHTGRFSGMMGFNMQNLPKGSALRKALRAPAGFKVIVADLKQIEARITACLADQRNMVEAFAAGRDVYTEFAAELYEKPEAEVTNDERFIGKMCILGLGFGMGAAKFKTTMDSLGIPMQVARATYIVKKYREFYPGVPRLWRRLDQFIRRISSLPINDSAWLGFPESAPVVSGKRDRVELPNGLCVHYPQLASDAHDPESFSFLESMANGSGRRKNLWGGSLCENIVQALARIIISRAEVRLARAGLTSVMQVHDELVFLVPESAVEIVIPVLKMVLTDPVPWMPGLPIACSIEVGDTYGDAK